MTDMMDMMDRPYIYSTWAPDKTVLLEYDHTRVQTLEISVRTVY